MSKQRRYWNRQRRLAAGNPNPRLAEMRVLTALLRRLGGDTDILTRTDALADDLRKKRRLREERRRELWKLS